MIKSEEWMKIRQLNQQGVPIARIAELLGRDWKTIAKAAKEPHAPKYKRTRTRPSKLDPYKALVQTKLAEAPYTATRLLEIIRPQGYTGGYTILQEYVASIKQQHSAQAVLRFETLPGQQMQVDWAEFAWVVTPDGTKKKLYAFSAILGYSRMRFVEFTFDQKLETLLPCLNHAFEYFGGVVKEVLFDNMKTVVLDRDLNEGTIRFNPRFLDFAGYYSFTPKLTWPYRAQTKGKIERTIGYIRQDFWPGITFISLEDLNNQALAWCEKVNIKVHHETKEIPKDRLAREDLIKLYAKAHYDTRTHHARRVSKDCFISFEGSLYSVPFQYACRDVTMLADNNKLEIFFATEKIAQHCKASASGMKLQEAEHFKGLVAQTVGQIKRGAIRKLPTICLPPHAHGYACPPAVAVEVRSPAFYETLVREEVARS